MTQILKKLYPKLFAVVARRWVLFLVALGVLLLVVNFLGFKPGFFSTDSIRQYSQAVGEWPLEDWHPIALAQLWRLLLWIFSSPSIMLLVQLTVLWAGIIMFSLFVYLRAKKKLYSLLPFLIGLSPYVFSVSSTIWKDVHLAVASFTVVAASLLLFQLQLKNKIVKSIILVGGATLLAYASAVRHSPAIYLLPIVIIFVWTLFSSKRFRYLAGIAVFLLMLMTPKLLDKVFSPRKVYLETSVMLDDIVNVRSKTEVEKSELPQSAKKYIVEVMDSCKRTGEISGTLLRCKPKEGHFRDRYLQFSIDHHDEVKKYWLQTLTGNPVEYVGYRLKAYTNFIFSERVYAWHTSRVDKNDLGLEKPINPVVNYAGSLYNFTLANFGFGFRSYFWILVNLTCLTYALKNRKKLKLFMYTAGVSSSGLFLALSFLPTTMAYQYRYLFWLTLSGITAGILILVDLSKQNTRKTIKR